jgi:hypothetical protein
VAWGAGHYENRAGSLLQPAERQERGLAVTITITLTFPLNPAEPALSPNAASLNFNSPHALTPFAQQIFHTHISLIPFDVYS